MAREFAKQFYSSKAWKDCRMAYIKSVGGLCERCLSAGRIRAGSVVHHKIRVEPWTITDASITLDHSNLELLCRECHELEHDRMTERRWRVDEFGNVIPR